MAYVIMGSVISSVISSLGEMTALMPVNAPIMEFPRRFLDRGVGFAVGWMYWFAYAVMGADQLVALSNSIKFNYDDGRTVLVWALGQTVDNAVWITVFLVLIVIINMLPVRAYGELEYVFGSLKLAFIVMLIVMMFVLDLVQPNSRAYYAEPLDTTYWNTPWSFFSTSYRVNNDSGGLQRTIQGSLGTFLGVWTTLINVLFSYVGMEIVAATASESRSLADAESMKMAARKLNIRVILLYCLAVFTASFTVPYTHPFLNGQATSTGAHSIFIIAVVEAGLPAAAHFFNAFYVFSTFTCCINNLYVASRVLHTLALRGQTGPEWITRRLRQTRAGVPMRAVVFTSIVFMLSYMGRSGSPETRLSELSNNSTVSCCIVYIVICATYLSFYQMWVSRLPPSLSSLTVY
jgi:amino acid transporter